MTTPEDIKFCNSCGKIYTDTIILATSDKESEIAISSIKSIRFSAIPRPTSLFFIALPAILFLLPYITNEESAFINGMFIVTGILLMLLSARNLAKKYTLSLKLTEGKTISINVAPYNVKEAKKFVRMVKSRMRAR